MNKKTPDLKILILFSVILMMVASCQETPEIYTHPDWLGGSNIETLEKEGDCTIFLALMEKADYRLPIEKQLFALFVPRDDAFKEYFNSRGIGSVDDLSKEEAFRLFTMFVLPNPLSRYQIIYEYAWDLEGPQGEYGALFFRKRTRSLLPAYKETPLYHPIYAGEELTIETNVPIWIPFFSTEFMEDYFATPDGSDYEFLCRGSKWSGSQWHDAMITEAERRTSNGFIYFLDKVVIQHPTADEYLKNNPDKYSTFYNMIQPFATYTRWENPKKEIVYRKGYDTDKIYDIANPDGPNAASGSHHVKRDIFTLFMPSNEAWSEYFANNNITDFQDLSEITRIYLIQSHILRTLALKSKIDNGLGNTFGDVLDVNTDTDITGAYLSNNAAIYDLNRVLEPFIFKTVTGPVFLDLEYSTFLLTMYLADKMNLVSSKDFDVTVFPISNAQFEEIGVRYNEIDNRMEFLTPQERWVEFTAPELSLFIEGFIVKEKLTDLSGEGFVELVSGEYAYYNDNKLFAAGNFEDNDYAEITGSIENDINGMLYYIDTPLKASHNTTAQSMLNDPELSEFFNLMLAANLVTTAPDPRTFEVVTRINFLRNSNDWTVFAPTNEAIIEARNNGLIPTAVSELRNFIYNHVISENVIFDDGKVSGTFNTRYATSVTPAGTVYSKIQIQNESKNMVITDASGQEVTVPHEDANLLVRSGVIHKIPKALLLPQQP
jgi:uncharacterized surface protein with fasciclin (FAS1) repeats